MVTASDVSINPRVHKRDTMEDQLEAAERQLYALERDLDPLHQNNNHLPWKCAGAKTGGMVGRENMCGGGVDWKCGEVDEKGGGGMWAVGSGGGTKDSARGRDRSQSMDQEQWQDEERAAGGKDDDDEQGSESSGRQSGDEKQSHGGGSRRKKGIGSIFTRKHLKIHV